MIEDDKRIEQTSHEEKGTTLVPACLGAGVGQSRQFAELREGLPVPCGDLRHSVNTNTEGWMYGLYRCRIQMQMGSLTVWPMEMRSQPMEVALSGVEVVERDILAVLFLPFELIDVMMMMMMMRRMES